METGEKMSSDMYCSREHSKCPWYPYDCQGCEHFSQEVFDSEGGYE